MPSPTATQEWVDRRSAMRAAFRALDRVQLRDLYPRTPAEKRAMREYYEAYSLKLRACRVSGVIDPGPQNPRW